MISKGAFQVLSFHFSSHTLSLISCVYLFSQSSVHGTNLANVRWTYKPSGLECCDMAGQVSKIAGQTRLQVSADSGADPGEGVDWVVSLPPLWGQISLKLWKGIELSLRRVCLLSGQSPPFQKSWICHWDWKFCVLNSFLFKLNLYALAMKWFFSDLHVLGSWLAIIWLVKCELVCEGYLFSELPSIWALLI